MSDELAIQPQIIQPKKDNSALYGATGAVGGATAGWFTSKYLLNGAKNLSDLAADASSKDKVELASKYKEIEEATIGDLADKANALKEAEAKLTEAKAPVLNENHELMSKFNNAQNDYEKALEKAKKEISGGKTATGAHEFPKITIDPDGTGNVIPTGAKPDQVKVANEHLKEALKKKGVKGSKKGSLAEQFRADYKELMEARAEVESQLTGIRNNRRLSVAGYDTELAKLVNPSARMSILENLTEAEFNNIVNKTHEKVEVSMPGKFGITKKVKMPALNKLSRDIAESELQALDESMTSFEESVLKELGATEGKAPTGGKYKTFTVERLNSNGEIKEVTFYMKESEFNGAIKKYNKNLDKLRERRAGQIRHGFRQRIADAQKARNYKSNIINEIAGNFTKEEIQVLEREGLITRNAGKIADITEATISGWDSNPNQFADIINDKTKTDTERAAARAKNHLRKVYNREMKVRDRILTNAYTGVPSFETFDTQVTEAYTKNERLAKINKTFEEKYKGVIENGRSLTEEVAEKSTMTESEIAEAASKKKEVVDLKKKVDDLSKQVENAKKSEGVVNESAVKAAEEAKNKAKGEFDSALKNITEKYGKGKWKIAAPVIGALALGAAGWFAGRSNEV